MIYFACLLACIVLMVSSADGQTVGAMGGIDGRVTDRTGAVAPGVTVVVSSDALIGNAGTRTADTNRDGQYRFPALPPGEYTLTFSRQGFRTVHREGVRVGLGFTATVNIELEIAALQERVTVERISPVVDTRSTSITASFDARQLEALPGARTMGAILAAAPAVQVTLFDIAGNTGVPGPYGAYGTSGFNRPMVEGLVLTGILTTGFSLNYGSFEEVTVGTAAHGVEWPSPGVQMQFISKSGGNQYRGTIFADYENHQWQPFNIDESQIARGAEGGGGLSPREANRLWSYHDVNADVGGYIKPDTLWWYFSFREQDVSARQVNFPVTPRRTHVMNYSAKGTYQVTPANKVIVFGQAGGDYQPNRLAGFTLGEASAVNLSEESTAEQRGWGWIWKGEWNAVIDDHLFFEVRAGQFGGNRPERPNGTSARFEDVTTSLVAGGNRDWQRNLRRNQALGSFSHFKDRWFGNHHFKVGGEILRTTATEVWRKAYPGDVLHVLRNGQPSQVYLFEPSLSEDGLWQYAAHAADSWQMNARITLNAGVRFDRLRLFQPAQTHPAGRFNPTPQTFTAVDNVSDWSVIAPRIGAVYDLSGDSRTLVKFSLAQYRLGFDSPLDSVNPNSNPWWRRYAWSDVNGSGVWEKGEEGQLQASRGGVALESLDPGMQLPVVHEVGGWVERELLTNVGLRTGVVRRDERRHFMRQNANWPIEAFTDPVVIPDPGPDGQVGTFDDGRGIPGYNLRPELLELQSNTVRNVPNSDSHYWTWDIAVNKRFSGRSSLVAGFAHTWNRDQAARYFGQSVRQNQYPLTPNDLINAGPDGRYEFRMWSAKIYGTVEGPSGVRVTPFLRHQSGQPFGRTFTTALNYNNNVRVLAEPIGTRRMDTVTILDVRVEKEFRLAAARRVAGFVDVYNLFNANPEQITNWSSGSSFLQPLSIVAPRIARIGATLEW